MATWPGDSWPTGGCASEVQAGLAEHWENGHRRSHAIHGYPTLPDPTNPKPLPEKSEPSIREGRCYAALTIGNLPAARRQTAQNTTMLPSRRARLHNEIA